MRLQPMWCRTALTCGRSRCRSHSSLQRRSWQQPQGRRQRCRCLWQCRHRQSRRRLQRHRLPQRRRTSHLLATSPPPATAPRRCRRVWRRQACSSSTQADSSARCWRGRPRTRRPGSPPLTRSLCWSRSTKSGARWQIWASAMPGPAGLMPGPRLSAMARAQSPRWTLPPC
jgi:hypothetical protein